MRHSHNAKFAQKMYTIFPGEFYVSSEDVIINTLLGSCVSVVLYDPVTQQGGMNHFLLPENPGTAMMDTPAGHYGINAMELLINDLLKRGVQKRNLHCKVYGGGKIIATGSELKGIHTANINFALTFLTTEKYNIIAADLGGRYTRKLYFFPKSGKVLIERVAARESKEIIKEENKYQHKIQKKEKSWGEMEIFNNPKHNK